MTEENYEDLMYDLITELREVCERYQIEHPDFVDDSFVLDSLSIARQEWKRDSKDEEIKNAVDDFLNDVFNRRDQA